jgi:hypothetical protein
MSLRSNTVCHVVRLQTIGVHTVRDARIAERDRDPLDGLSVCLGAVRNVLREPE